MRIFFGIAMFVLGLAQLAAVEILEADPFLSGRLIGKTGDDVSFGQDVWRRDFRRNDYLVGSIEGTNNIEGAVLFAFRIDQDFIDRSQGGGKIEFMFTVISMHEGDGQKVLPVDIELLKQNSSSAYKAAKLEVVQKLGSIADEKLEVGSLYRFPLDDSLDLKDGDIVWVGINGRNPVEDSNHNFLIGGDLISLPGSVPPMLVAGDKEDLSETVRGISFLTLLHGRLNSPATPESITTAPPKDITWVNPFASGDEIDRLEAVQNVLKTELEKLPQPHRQLRGHSFGFHSSIKPLDETWSLHLPVNEVATALCLVPSVTVEGDELQTFGFPERFSITAQLPDGAGEVVIADWTNQDFPLRSTTPVVFSFPWQFYESINFTVYEGTKNADKSQHSFSLEEIILYRPSQDRQFRTIVDVAAADSIRDKPYWSPEYLTDGLTSLGPAVMERAENSGDEIISFGTDLPAPPEIVLKLPTKQSIFSLDFYPVINPENPALSALSFPQEVSVEFSTNPKFENIVHSIDSYPLRNHVPVRGNPTSVRFEELEVRFIKLRFNKLAPSEQGAQLGLAEIRINDGLSLANSRISLVGFPENTASSQFIDNRANGFLLGDPIPWIIRLIRRDIISSELDGIERGITMLQKASQRTATALFTSFGGISLLFFGGILLWQKRKNAAENLKVRRRIQQDLHDEIGSNLGTVSLITSHLLNTNSSSEFLEELEDVNRSAREATSSLREVIWLTDKSILTLDKAFSYIEMRAEQMVRNCELIVDAPKSVPAIPISGLFKRNLFLLFTEVIHNSQKHARAKKIVLTMRLEGDVLTMTVTDDGQGFDLATVREGIGIGSMRERARQLGGNLDIDSSPDSGTTIELTLTLKPTS